MADSSHDANLPVVAGEQGLLALLKSTFRQADAVATGALGTERLQLLMIPGRLVQAARNRSFVEQLAIEIEDLADKGRLRPDFEQSPETNSALQELLAALEEPPVDDAKFDALKNIFIAAATRGTPSDVPPQLILAVARTLSTGELVVLATAYRLGRDDPGATARIGSSANSWFMEIARGSGIGLAALVEHYAGQLAAKNLIGQRTYSDRSGMNMGKHFGLTDFGVRLCELIERGATESAGASKAPANSR